MGQVYVIVITVLLLFPWSLVALMLGGAALTRVGRWARARRGRAGASPGRLGLTASRPRADTPRPALSAPLPR